MGPSKRLGSEEAKGSSCAIHHDTRADLQDPTGLHGTAHVYRGAKGCYQIGDDGACSRQTSALAEYSFTTQQHARRTSAEARPDQGGWGGWDGWGPQTESRRRGGQNLLIISSAGRTDQHPVQAAQRLGVRRDQICGVCPSIWQHRRFLPGSTPPAPPPPPLLSPPVLPSG